MAQWGECSFSTIVGTELQQGQLEIIEGTATLTFASGAVVNLEAPVKMELVSAPGNDPQLNSGFDTKKSTKLGTFTIPRGQQSGEVKVCRYTMSLSRGAEEPWLLH